MVFPAPEEPINEELVEFVPQLSAFAVAAFRLLPSVGKINEHMSATLYSAPSLELIYHDLKGITFRYVGENPHAHNQQRYHDSCNRTADRIQINTQCDTDKHFCQQLHAMDNPFGK